MKRSVPVEVTCLILLTMIFLSGCGGSSAPSKFYLLSSLAKSDAQTRNPESPVRLAVGVGPVEVPAYLDRPQIVTRLSLNTLRLAEFDKWAEPLKDTVSRITNIVLKAAPGSQI